jgi:hypothetical protein
MRESQAFEGVKPIPTPAKELDNPGLARQPIDA